MVYTNGVQYFVYHLYLNKARKKRENLKRDKMHIFFQNL